MNKLKLTKYNCKIDHNIKSNGNYRKLTNGKIIVNREEQSDIRSFNKFAISKLRINEIKQLFKIQAKAFRC